MPEMISRFSFNIDANDLGNIDVISSAVGALPGEITLHVNESQRGQSNCTGAEGYLPIAVQIRTLADIVSQSGLNKIDAMKIDIEGHEDRALLPFINTVPQQLWPRKILMEVVHAVRWESDCLRELLQAGYREIWRGSGDVLLELASASPA